MGLKLARNEFCINLSYFQHCACLCIEHSIIGTIRSEPFKKKSHQKAATLRPLEGLTFARNKNHSSQPNIVPIKVLMNLKLFKQ